MGHTACTEPQCLYSRTITLLPLWVVRPVQSLSTCARVRLQYICLKKKSFALTLLLGIANTDMSAFDHNVYRLVT
jgi:hypothetical protein